MKPIEPGCLVVVLYAENSHLVGMCGTTQGQGICIWTVGPDGSVNRASNDWWAVKIPGIERVLCRPAKDLMRIDDYEPETQEQDQEVTA